ncbi:MAG: MTAP family purine nucleoside phosphorylase [Nitrososphaerales archaeon]|nr:MTAP family purine nucleoside phosphorylase [Nitrososphaerales archaeon]
MKRNSLPTIAVITGTGVTEHFEVGPPKPLKTKYGAALVFKSKDGRFYVLPRHGPGHKVPPHRINYTANIAGLRALGVTTVIATSAVGSINPEFRVGEMGLAEQFLDFTKGRQSTFFDREVAHTDMTEPYSGMLNWAIQRGGESVGVKLRTGLVYVCAEGPRFESAAEIRMFKMLGGDVVGMTGVPEVVLAKEMGMNYSSIVIATNWAAGIQEKVSHTEVLSVMKSTGEVVRKVVEATVNHLPKTPPEREA